MSRRFGPSIGSAVPLQGHKARMGTGFTGTGITIIWLLCMSVSLCLYLRYLKLSI